MKAERVEQLLNEYPQFVISYYAKKHGKIINRQGTWTKPNTDTQGKHFVSKEEFKTFEMWQQAKGQLIMAHYKWIKSVLNQMKEIKMGLKGYRYLDEAIELCTELGLNVQEDEVIRTNSTGLVIYNPKNLAERIKGMKNKNFSREDKIKARLLYEAQSQVVN